MNLYLHTEIVTSDVTFCANSIELRLSSHANDRLCSINSHTRVRSLHADMSPSSYQHIGLSPQDSPSALQNRRGPRRPSTAPGTKPTQADLPSIRPDISPPIADTDRMHVVEDEDMQTAEVSPSTEVPYLRSSNHVPSCVLLTCSSELI